MTKNKRVFIVNGTHTYETFFNQHGWITTKVLSEADLVQFTGGADVSPDLYGENRHASTMNNPDRDAREIFVFKKAMKLGTPMAGICRGGQFLNVMMGGKMYQDVDGHATGQPHIALDVENGEEFHVTSTHHQMMRPGPEGRVFLKAKESTRRLRMAGPTRVAMSLSNTNLWDDVEGIIYEAEKILCFQPHPEFVTAPQLGRRYMKYLDNYLF